jgi:catalase
MHRHEQTEIKMTEPSRPPARMGVGALVLIAAVVGGSAVAFAYTAGWLSPDRLTPERMVAAFAGPPQAELGHRRNHAKGICFTGAFEASGEGAELSTAPMLARGSYPVVGRFNLGTENPDAADATVRVRGMGLQITAPGGAVWRMAMINPPVFVVSTVQGFYDLLTASSSKAPDALKQFVAAHPEFAGFGAWAGSAPWMASYAAERFNGLNAFLFVDGGGAAHPVRWSLLPAAAPEPIAPDELAKRGPDYLEHEIATRVQGAPQRWTMVATLAAPGDPTADPTKAWPADRRNVTLGTLTVQQVEPEADGPCRDINFDPTVLPAGIRVSDDPFPAARSAAYRVSYDLRTAEASHYPAHPTSTKP